METMNFYFIEIGTFSRAGNLTVMNSFAVKSEKKEYNVRDFYIEKYKGFGVRVTTINNVEEFVAKEDVNKSLISELKNQIKKMENDSKNTFVIELGYSDFTEEQITLYKEAKEAHNALYSKIDALDNALLASTCEKFRPFIKDMQSLLHVDNFSYAFKCRLRLVGKLF